jgi:putative peptidoglycan lipid II flippase
LPPNPSGEKGAADNVVRSAGIVSLAVLSSRVTGLMRETVIAALFGAGRQADAFRIGFLIPNLTRDLFAEGALSSAFVPIFTKYLATKSKAEAAALANLVATVLILIVGSFCILGAIFSPILVSIVASGFKQTPGKFELTVQLTRIMFPFLLLVALAAQAMGILNACNQFGVPAMASTFFNIGSLFFGVLLGKWLGPSLGISEIHGMAYGVVLGGALQLLWQVPSLSRAGFAFRPRIDWSDPGLRSILALMGPAILGNAAVQINVTVNNHFASRLADNGPVTWLNCAFRFMQLPIGIFGVAIASATLPAISRSAAVKDFDGFRQALSRSLGLVFLLTVPSAVGLAVLGESIISAIYQWGEFSAADTTQTARALSFYAVGLVGYAAAKVINPAFYALNDSRTPMAVSLGSIFINLIMVATMIYGFGFGHEGLALSTSAVAIFSSVALFTLMRKRIGGIYGRNLWHIFVRVSAASLVMGSVVWFASRQIASFMGPSKAARFAELGVGIPLGLTVLYLMCRILGVSELDLAIKALVGPLQRRFAGQRARITGQ